MSTVTPEQARQRIAPLLGLPAWRVERGWGSFVDMEFGDPLPPDQDGRVYGRWHLWVMMAAWRLESADRVLAGSEDAALQQALDHLEGRPLTDVLIAPGTLATTFDFDGLRLRTFPLYRPDPDGHEYDHWLLWLDGSGDVLVADSRLRIGRDDEPGTPGER
ncbi:hypothetical protein ACFY00_16025 [Kitasatospora sp. NPDC001540]|uniref:hypothetical protein n=1 Tax=Kitasatospora sp. NPDC001540 TaxID=3364014 RepID=UPI0036A722D1